jgi:hypothetical protein
MPVPVQNSKVVRARVLSRERHDKNREAFRKRSLDYYYEVLRKPPKMNVRCLRRKI